MYTVDVRHIYFLSFLELALITILKLFYTKIVAFKTFWGVLYLYCLYFAFLAYVFNVLRIYT